jgi:hypothetical protein
MNQLFFLQLSEMAADLAEEHSTATLATERLEAEQSERMRLEKDRGDLEVYPVLMNLIYQLIIKLLGGQRPYAMLKAPVPSITVVKQH